MLECILNEALLKEEYFIIWKINPSKNNSKYVQI